MPVKGGYDEDGVMNYLRSVGVGLDTRKTGKDEKVSKTVFIEPGMLGIRGLGRVDFLVNHCYWHLVIRKGKGAYVG